MASDLETEIFAYKWFYREELGSALSKEKYDDMMEIYKDEHSANPECIQASESDDLYEAIGLRVRLFQNIYLVEIQTQIDKFRHSRTAFEVYVIETCNRNDLFGSLKIFDRVFATCAFVRCLRDYCYHNGYLEIVTYGYVSWAIFFDKFTDDFYKLGGWTRLKSVALSYKPPIDFLQNEKVEESSDITLIKLRKVIYRYNLFKKVGEIDHDKSISLSWVKFSIQILNGSYHKDFDQFTDESHSNDIKSCSEVEDILKQLKYLCDPNASEIIKNVGQKSTTDSVKTSMANLNICDKYVNLDSKEETIVTLELKQNTTSLNLASKSAKKLKAVEENILISRNPDKVTPMNSEVSTKRKSLIKFRGVSKDDYMEKKYSQLKSQEQDLKTTAVENLFENLTDKPAPINSESSTKRRSLIKFRTVPKDDYIKKGYSQLKSQEQDPKTTTVENVTISNSTREKEVKRNTSLIGEMPPKRTNADEKSIKKTQDDATKEHNEWTLVKSAKRSASLIGQKSPAKKNAEKESGNKTQDDVRKEQEEWKGTKNAKREKNSNMKCETRQKHEDESKEKENNNKTQDGVRKEQEEWKGTKNAKRKKNSKMKCETRQKHEDESKEKENSNKTQAGVRKKQEQWKGTKNAKRKKNSKNKSETMQKHEDDSKEKEGEKKSTILIGETSSTRKNAEEEITKTRNSLREEQEDGDVKKFLRMVLVLGDKEGIRYVIETSQFDNKEFNA